MHTAVSVPVALLAPLAVVLGSKVSHARAILAMEDRVALRDLTDLMLPTRAVRMLAPALHELMTNALISTPRSAAEAAGWTSPGASIKAPGQGGDCGWWTETGGATGAGRPSCGGLRA